MSLSREFTKGLWKEIPPFRVVLGTCPTLALTTSAYNGWGMGLCIIFVLTFSNLFISLLRNIIPDKVRLAAYIVIIATFVTITDLVVKAYAFELSQALGYFIPLIVVNCIILGRAEAFANKNGVLASVLDGLGMGVGFTMSLLVLGSLREILGSGYITLLVYGDLIVRYHVLPESYNPAVIMILPTGAFLAFGTVLWFMNWINDQLARRQAA